MAVIGLIKPPAPLGNGLKLVSDCGSNQERPSSFGRAETGIVVSGDSSWE